MSGGAFGAARAPKILVLACRGSFKKALNAFRLILSQNSATFSASSCTLFVTHQDVVECRHADLPVDRIMSLFLHRLAVFLYDVSYVSDKTWIYDGYVAVSFGFYVWAQDGNFSICFCAVFVLFIELFGQVRIELEAVGSSCD